MELIFLWHREKNWKNTSRRNALEILWLAVQTTLGYTQIESGHVLEQYFSRSGTLGPLAPGMPETVRALPQTIRKLAVRSSNLSLNEPSKFFCWQHNKVCEPLLWCYRPCPANAVDNSKWHILTHSPQILGGRSATFTDCACCLTLKTGHGLGVLGNSSSVTFPGIPGPRPEERHVNVIWEEQFITCCESCLLANS